MQPIYEELPFGRVPAYDLCRGTTVRYTSHDGTFQIWYVPFTGPTRFICPSFHATKVELDKYCTQLQTMGPNAYEIRTLRFPNDNDGKECWGAFSVEELDETPLSRP